MILRLHDIRRCLPGQDAVTRERDNYYILSFIRWWVGEGEKRNTEAETDRDKE